MISSKTIIVVSQPQEQAFFREGLHKAGYRVLVAESSERVVELAVEHNVGLILVSVILPGPNGFQITRRLLRNEHTKSIPIVLMDKEFSETNKVWGLKQGASDYIEQPADRKKLRAASSKFSDFFKHDNTPSFESSRKTSFSTDELSLAEQHLAHYLGPLAKVFVKKTAAQAGNLDELYAMLADHLESESDKKRFLALRKSVR